MVLQRSIALRNHVTHSSAPLCRFVFRRAVVDPTCFQPPARKTQTTSTVASAAAAAAATAATAVIKPGGLLSGPARMMRMALQASGGGVPYSKDISQVKRPDCVRTSKQVSWDRGEGGGGVLNTLTTS